MSVADWAPTFAPHLPPVWHGRAVVDLPLPGDRAPARAVRRESAVAADPDQIPGQTELPLIHHQPTLWSL